MQWNIVNILKITSLFLIKVSTLSIILLLNAFEVIWSKQCRSARDLDHCIIYIIFELFSFVFKRFFGVILMLVLNIITKLLPITSHPFSTKLNRIYVYSPILLYFRKWWLCHTVLKPQVSKLTAISLIFRQYV